MTEQIVTVTKKGQATIPKEMRKRHGIVGKALVVEVKEGVLVKPLPQPSAERGSLKSVFGGRTSTEVLVEARKEDLRRHKQLLEHARQ
jgi:AbrB family looped-hinge helix DNA binding protein